MNGPLIFTIIHIIKALKCIEQEETIKNQTVKIDKESNGTVNEDVYNREIPQFVNLPTEDECSCPCNGVLPAPVCGKTTNGILKTFTSQCHLICHNQCGSTERYAIISEGDCPLFPVTNRKNIFSNGYETRRNDYYFGPYSTDVFIQHPYANNYYQSNDASYEFRKPSPSPYVNSYQQAYLGPTSGTSPYEIGTRLKPSSVSAAYTAVVHSVPFNSYDNNINRLQDLAVPAYTSIITQIEPECDCSHCPDTRWIRLDYYPICAERNGLKRTFDSWCHFDCENKCVRHAGGSYMYLQKGACEMGNERESVTAIPRTFNVVYTDTCNACSSLCKDYFEPLCSKNSKNEYLSFKSRCHMRCHNQCHYQKTKENYVQVYDGHCTWL